MTLGYLYQNSLGQLSPSKSIGGFKVYGLAGRLEIGIDNLFSSSLESRAGASRLMGPGGIPSCTVGLDSCSILRSKACSLLLEEMIEDASLSRSFTPTKVRKGEPTDCVLESPFRWREWKAEPGFPGSGASMKFKYPLDPLSLAFVTTYSSSK